MNQIKFIKYIIYQEHLIKKYQIDFKNERPIWNLIFHQKKVIFNKKFFNIIGTGIDKLLTTVSKECADLITKMLTYDPEHRITADQALNHEYFREYREIE